MKLGRSLRLASKVSGLSNAHLCQIENSDGTPLLACSWTTLCGLCRAYDITDDALVKELRRLMKKKGRETCAG